MPAEVTWLDLPEDHDYTAAERYLTLLMPAVQARSYRARLEENSEDGTVLYQAKDILRASGLPLLPEVNKHVAADLAKIRARKRLSPVLLLRGTPLVIADGYHRVCAAYLTDENTEVPVVIGL